MGFFSPTVGFLGLIHGEHNCVHFALWRHNWVNSGKVKSRVTPLFTPINDSIKFKENNNNNELANIETI